ncbi:MAG: SDR family oxidoreductase [Hyphomicrobiales bacterium]|nr:SDR family oxidoreductase [Hyphomicrobiales bacterium]MDE2018348.1 SDR family oxidoreductase [Hyphomicrobiales bacterium]
MLEVVVTGASRGLGLAIAARLARAGYGIVGVARKESAEFAALAAAPELAGRLRFRAFDVGEVAAIPDFAKALRADVGRIHGLVNNAGTSTHGLLTSTPDSEIERVLRVNALAPILLSKHLAKGMMAAGGGRIVNVSSIVASGGASGIAAYAASKGAISAFTRSLARELGRAGITVNAVAPGYVDTAMTSSMSEDDLKRVIGRAALRRLAEPEDVAAAVEFLMGEGARNVTGATLTVDAGMTA